MLYHSAQPEVFITIIICSCGCLCTITDRFDDTHVLIRIDRKMIIINTFAVRSLILYALNSIIIKLADSE